MQRCPKCNQTYKDNAQKFCTNDGGRLIPLSEGDCPAKYIFLDIVGFTRGRSIEAQSDIVYVLNEIVRSSVANHKLLDEKVIFIPTGDGICIALLNVDIPYDIHLQIALAILKGVKKHNSSFGDTTRSFQVRIGINANTDSLVTDINGNRNIAGAGISMAARVMDLADGGQILVGQQIFENLQYREKYISAFRLLQAKIKHNLNIHVYQFVSEGCDGLDTNIPSAFQSSDSFRNLQPELFFHRISNLGILCLHICSVAFVNRKPFNLRQLCTQLQLLNYDYATGFLVACASSGLIEVQQSNEIWTVLAVDEAIQRRVKNLVKERVDKITSPPLKEQFMTDHAQIVMHFIIT